MSGTSRHKACNHCREKKIRCDGGQPCQRCQNSGDNCDYSTQTKPSKLDLTQALEAFNDRLFHAESALAAQQNVPTRPYPALPTAAFDADNMALWSQPMGAQESTPERNVTPYPTYGQRTTSSMNIPPPLDFANPSFYPFDPNPNLAPMNPPMPPLSTAAHGSSMTSLPQLGDTSTTFPLNEYSSDGSDSGRLRNPGSVSRNWTGSNLSSRITTPGTSGALSEAMDTIPQHIADDL
ncbi:MAG: hypothetical protein LQ346_002258 [Caloplaca aetnensis]|nr:MAG: hypothetical protein LQ346_002258 [Caloplaca aetnensis]